MIKEYKLYVVGEDDPDPETWSIWSEYALVIARDKEEALKLLGELASEVHEVKLDSPKVLVVQPEPNWGSDI